MSESKAKLKAHIEMVNRLHDHLSQYEPLEEDEEADAREHASDSGNYDDAYTTGIDIGERLVADEVREILKGLN